MTSRAHTIKDDEDEQERAGVAGQPFVQAQERNSVIFFSAGKKLFRVRHLETQESSSHQPQLGPDSSEQRTSKLPEDILSVGGPTYPLKSALHNLHRGNADTHFIHLLCFDAKFVGGILVANYKCGYRLTD